jgi:hypothetical protein
MEKFIVVLPYQERSSLFTASKTIQQEDFVGVNDTVVYYEYQAKQFTESEAIALSNNHANNQSFIRIAKKFNNFNSDLSDPQEEDRDNDYEYNNERESNFNNVWK